MKKLLLTTAAILATGAMAHAADLPARMPVKAPPVFAPAFSWTGCYIGGFAGGAWSADDNVTTTSPTGLAPYAYGYSSDSSFIGGGTLGCNWQPVGSPFVLGLEGEVGYISLESSAFDPTIAPALGSIVSSTKVGDWYGMVTGRLGYSWDRAMIYVKGGAAFVEVESAIGVTVLGAAPATFAGSTKDTVATWTVGGGLEWAFDMNWSLKAEYMYIGLDETQAICTTGVCWSNDIGGIHTAKVGLNYRFGGGAPLVARY